MPYVISEFLLLEELFYNMLVGFNSDFLFSLLFA